MILMGDQGGPHFLLLGREKVQIGTAENDVIAVPIALQARLRVELLTRQEIT